MVADNKVMFGLKNVTLFPLTDDGSKITYSTPVKFRGAVSLGLDPEGDKIEFEADNQVYYTADNNQGFSGKLEMALMPFEVSTIVLGDVRDTNGVILQSAKAGQAVGMAFEFDGDVKATRHILYNVTFSRPSENGETRGKKGDVKGTEFEINAALHPYFNIAKAKTDATTNDTAYQTWYTKVYEPTMQAPTSK